MLAAASREEIPEIFGCPTFLKGKRDGDDWCPAVIVDRYGSIIRPATAFLCHLDRGEKKAEKTIVQYGSILADLLALMDGANNQKGIGLHELDDDFLSRLHDHFTGPVIFNRRHTGNRGVTARTFKTVLALLLRYISRSQNQGWIKKIMGVGDSFQIKLEPSDSGLHHKLLSGSSPYKRIKLPSDDCFDLVDAAVTESPSDPHLIKRNDHMTRVIRQGLRRKELANMPVTCLPSRETVKRLRKKAGDTGVLPEVSITITSAKSGHDRSVLMPLALVETLRDYVDFDRSLHKIATGETAIFLSKTTGKALAPQSITNLFKDAARLVAEECEDEDVAEAIREIHPHSYRHKSITDDLVQALDEGREYVHALLDTMDKHGIKRPETAQIYTHLADRQRHSESMITNEENKAVDEKVRKSLEALNAFISVRRQSRKQGRR